MKILRWVGGWAPIWAPVAAIIIVDVFAHDYVQVAAGLVGGWWLMLVFHEFWCPDRHQTAACRRDQLVYDRTSDSMKFTDGSIPVRARRSS